MPVVKNDYDIYSKSPPKSKSPSISINNNGGSQSNIKQRHSISIGMLQHNNVKVNHHTNRVHSKSVTEPPKRYIITRSRSSSSNNNSISTSNSSNESLDVVRNMMMLKLSESSSEAQKIKTSNKSSGNNKPSSPKLSIFQTAKNYWTINIKRNRKRSSSTTSPHDVS